MESGAFISIKPMILEDLNWVVRTEKLCFSDAWSRGQFESEIIQNNFSKPIIAEIDNEKAGYAAVRFIGDELQIANIAVHPKYRRKKIASAMISYIIDERDKKTIKFGYLEVNRNNYGAIGLYKDFGFTEIEIRKNYYAHDSEDAVIMMKELN